ncbi:MAG TPA: LacI family DNA-binding transcriptional regulator [Bryobacteraceae bacterium]|nr:LacI family DNA-binding transcriptional regulator [Bryobacteraceae bacterium]
MSRNKPRYPTLVDIAELAGVAPMTVSRVINGSGSVSGEMRKRVQSALDRLDYHPNALARSLRNQGTRVVGILLSDIQNPYSAELAGSIQDELLQHNYSAFLCTTDRSIEREQAALNALFEHRVAGIIVATLATDEGNQALERVVKLGLPAVMVGRESRRLAVDRVTADQWQGAYEAVEHLIGLGHRRIGYVGASVLHAARLKRFQGFLDALRDRGLEAPPELIAGPENDSGPGYSTQQDGYEGMSKLLALPRRPTAVFARNDFTAMGAIAAARGAGVAIPDDLAIVGFDNVPMAAFTTPPLTTVDQPTVEQGRRAAAMLLERIQGKAGDSPRRTSFPCRLIVRASTVKVGATGSGTI